MTSTSKAAFQQFRDRLQSLLHRTVDLTNEVTALSKDAVELFQAVAKENNARKPLPPLETFRPVI
jgi:hypothetical protein